MEMEKRERNVNGTFKSSHGKRNTKLYRVWCGMKRRCYQPQDKRYNRYGGRGITVCQAWREDFQLFYEWAINNGYCEGLTIDRINNDAEYSPENCRWVTRAEQNRNYSRNHYITYRGETKCLSDWAEEFGISRATVLNRLKAGKTLDEVFSTIDGRSERWKKTIL